MEERKVKQCLFELFETGIFYNSAISSYYEEIQIFDQLEEIFKGDESSLSSVLNQINTGLRRKRSNFSGICIPYNLKEKTYLIRHIAIFLHSNLNLPWKLNFLKRELRKKYDHEFLMRTYFEAYSITKGFSSFPAEKLMPLIRSLDFFAELRKANFTISNRISQERLKSPLTLKLHFNEKISSFEQVIQTAIILCDNSDCLKHFNESRSGKKIRSMNDLLKLIIGLDFRIRGKINRLTKEGHYNDLIKKYPAELEKGFSDKRSINTCCAFIEEYKQDIQTYYTPPNLLQSNDDFYNNDTPLEGAVSPIIELHTILSVFIKFHSFIIANKPFFKRLNKLKEKILEDKKATELSEGELESRVSLILNHMTSDNLPPDKIFDEYKGFREKYSEDVLHLKDSNNSIQFWGYYFNVHFVPEVKELVTLLNSYQKLETSLESCSSHFINDISGRGTYKNARVLEKFIPRFTADASPLLSLSNPILLVIDENSTSLKQNLESALGLYNRTGLYEFLKRHALAKSLKEYELLVIGLYYKYQTEWLDEKITQENFLEKFDEIYSKTITKNKLRDGIKKIEELINAFRFST